MNVHGRMPTHRGDNARRLQVQADAESTDACPSGIHERRLFVPVPRLSQTEENVRLDDLDAEFVPYLFETLLGELEQLVRSV